MRRQKRRCPWMICSTRFRRVILKELALVVKADVQGSVEAVKQSLMKLSNEEVVVNVSTAVSVRSTSPTLSLATASSPSLSDLTYARMRTQNRMAEQNGVDIRLYRVIYQAIEDVEAAMKGMLEPVYEEKVIGHAEVRQLFKASGVGTIAGRCGLVFEGFNDLQEFDQVEAYIMVEVPR